MKVSITALMAMAGAFSPGGLGIKTPSCAWKHDEQRLEKAKRKRLRKEAKRCPSRYMK